MINKILFVSIFVFSLFTLTNNAFALDSKEPNKGAGIQVDSMVNTMDSIQEKVLASIPEFISTPVTSAIEFLEQSRIEEADKMTDKKAKLNKEETVKNFLLNIFLFILNNKIIFYLLALVLFSLILKFIWRLIF